MTSWRIAISIAVLGVFVAGQSLYREEDDDVTNGEVTVTRLTRRTNCTLTVNEDRNCQTCLDKGSDCFWCGGKVKKCMRYEWYFPDCDLDDVKHRKCWVNWTALIVVLSVIGGILLVIFLSVFCYCCCRCRECSRQRQKKINEECYVKEKQKRDELKMRQMERSAQREQDMSYYREKYGYPAKEASPLPEKK